MEAEKEANRPMVKRRQVHKNFSDNELACVLFLQKSYNDKLPGTRVIEEAMAKYNITSRTWRSMKDRIRCSVKKAQYD